MAMKVNDLIGRKIKFENKWYILEELIPCPPLPLRNSYPIRKVMLTDGLFISGELLVVFGMIDGDIVAVQLIDTHGNKKFLRGSKPNGCGFRYGDPDSATYYIAEGIATASTLFQEFGDCVYAAFTCTNLKHLATRLREKYPKKDLIICGDDDYTTEGNPGRKHAIRAAKASNSAYTFPDFTGLNRGPKDTDFNDLMRLIKGSKDEQSH